MKELGLNLISLLAQIINFGILFLVLKKVVFKPVLKIIDGEKKKARQKEKQAEKIETEERKIEETKVKELTKARKKASQIIAQSQQEAKEQKGKIIAEAKAKANETIKEAETEIKQKEKKMKEELKEYSAKLAVKIASKLIADFLGKEEQEKLINKAIGNLKKVRL